MNARRMIVPVASLVAALSYGSAVDARRDQLEDRVVALEAKVEKIESYLGDQAKAAAALDKKLDESEKAGFTYGINPSSREALLAGFRAFTAGAQKNVPGEKKKRD